MNINQLEYLVYSVAQGSFADAAKQLYVSPQAVSKALSDLEKELNLDLFVKSGRGITPTPECMLLATKAEEIVQNCEDLKSCASSLHSDNYDESMISGTISLAVSTSPYEGSVMANTFFSEFSKKYPRIKLMMSYCSSGAGLSALQEGIVDAVVAVGRFQKKGFLCTKLFDCIVQVAISASHPLSAAKLLSIADIMDYPVAKPGDIRFCSPLVERHLKERNYTKPLVHLQPTMDEYRRFLERSQGIVFVTQDPTLERTYTNVLFIQLRKEDQIKIPVCFVRYASADTRLMQLLHRNLLGYAKVDGAKIT